MARKKASSRKNRAKRANHTDRPELSNRSNRTGRPEPSARSNNADRLDTTSRGEASRCKLPLLVVDGYNVIRGTEYYQGFIDDGSREYDLPDVSHLGRDPYGHDPFERAREALVADVSAYAQGSYEAVIVYDGANNLTPGRSETNVAGVRVVFSAEGVSADSVIERMVVDARHIGRGVLLVTSDNTIRYTVGGEPVATISSKLLASDMSELTSEIRVERDDRNYQRMTLGDRLSPEQRQRLQNMLS